jgi:hypothetical protein
VQLDVVSPRAADANRVGLSSASCIEASACESLLVFGAIFREQIVHQGTMLVASAANIA